MTTTKPPKLSYSAKSTYEWCGRQYKYLYVDKFLPDKPVYPATVIGTGIHALISRMYQEKIFSLSFLHYHWYSHLQDAIKEHKFDASPKQQEAMFKLGKKIIGSFYYMAKKEGFLIPPLKTEWRFKLRLDTFALSGIVDLIIVVNGVVYIIDFKTGLKDLSQEEVDANEQLTFYALAVYTLLGIDNFRVGFFYPRTGKIKYSSRTPADYEALIASAREMLKKIEQKQFAPTYVKCNWCRYSSRCAAEDMVVKTGLSKDWFYTEPRK